MSCHVQSHHIRRLPLVLQFRWLSIKLKRAINRMQCECCPEQAPYGNPTCEETSWTYQKRKSKAIQQVVSQARTGAEWVYETQEEKKRGTELKQLSFVGTKWDLNTKFHMIVKTVDAYIIQFQSRLPGAILRTPQASGAIGAAGHNLSSCRDRYSRYRTASCHAALSHVMSSVQQCRLGMSDRWEPKRSYKLGLHNPAYQVVVCTPKKLPKPKSLVVGMLS